jgi:hypothetical protein
MRDEATAPVKPRKRGRPRCTSPGEVHVSVPIPQWLLEHIDAIGPNRGRTVARLCLERLQSVPQIQDTPGLTRQIEQLIYH